LTGGEWNHIELPKTFLDLPLEEQLVAVPELMLAYRRQYDGGAPFFGMLAGFKFVRLMDYFQFDKNGQLVQRVGKPFRLGAVLWRFQ